MRKCSALQSRDRVLPIAECFFAAILAALTTTVAAAQYQNQQPAQNTEQPVHIQAETLEILDKVKTATFSGNVRVVQGDTTMKCVVLLCSTGRRTAPARLFQQLLLDGCLRPAA